MIFAGIKENRIQKRFEKSLSKRIQVFSKEKYITKVLIVTSETNFQKEVLLNEFSEKLLLPKEAIDILVFQKKEQPITAETICFSPKSFRWNGKISDSKLQNILDKKHDVLIHLAESNNMYINLLTSCCQVPLKVGTANLDDRMFDLMFTVDVKEIKLFSNELKKYLQILNKIPCSNLKEPA